MAEREDAIQALAQVAVQLHKQVIGATAEQIAEFETRTGVVLPPALSDWALRCDGLALPQGGFYGCGYGEPLGSISDVLDDCPALREAALLPIASDGCGNYYVLERSSPAGPVLFVDTLEDPSQPQYAVASTVWRFVWFYCQQALGEERWPIDREWVLSRDPALTQFASRGFIWNT